MVQKRKKSRIPNDKKDEPNFDDERIEEVKNNIDRLYKPEKILQRRKRFHMKT